MVKQCAPVIAIFLAKVFNKCNNSAYFPDSCRIAKTIAFIKDGSKQNASNYRSISLLTVFSKIFEKLLHKRMLSFIKKHNTIIPEQFGFREKHSCIHAIARVSEFMRTTNDQYMGLAIFIDLKKALDTVDHSFGKIKCIRFSRQNY